MESDLYRRPSMLSVIALADVAGRGGASLQTAVRPGRASTPQSGQRVIAFGRAVGSLQTASGRGGDAFER